jgi:hypothetical protein
MTSEETVVAGIPLPQFAAVVAALSEGFGLRAVLAIEGLNAAQWTEADPGWSDRIHQDPKLLARYQTALTVAQSRLFSQDKAVHAEGAPDKPMLRAPKARLVPSWIGFTVSSAPVETTASGAPESSLPTYMREPPMLVPGFPVEAPMPLQPALVPLTQPPPRHDLAGTGTGMSFKVPAEYFPFQDTGEPSSSRPVKQKTQALPVRPEMQAHLANALPFRNPSSHDLDKASVRVEVGAGWDGTETLAAASETKVSALPWDTGASSLPVRAPAAPQAIAQPSLSLEHHACLCLEIAVDPTREDEALARYGVTAADKARADEYYRAQIAADPELYARWSHAYSAHYASFTQRPRP